MSDSCLRFLSAKSFSFIPRSMAFKTSLRGTPAAISCLYAPYNFASTSPIPLIK